MGLPVRVADLARDLRRVVQELRGPDVVRQTGQMDRVERPGEQVQVEPVTALGVAAVRRWRRKSLVKPKSSS